MKNITFKSPFIFCSIVLISALLFSMVSCAKKKPPEPAVQIPVVSAEDEARKRVEEEAAKAKEEEIKKRAEDEARKKAEEDARLKAEVEAKKKAEEEAEELANAKVEKGAKAGEDVKKAEGVKEGAVKTSHEVVKGECLWNIAKQKDVYENPFQWPLIYKANHYKINDPDLIYPKQVFSIPRDSSSDDKDKAIHHAKHRGEWSLYDGSEKYWEPGYKKK